MKKKIILNNYNKIFVTIYDKIVLWNNEEEDINIKQEKLKILSREIIDLIIDSVFEEILKQKNNE